MNAVKTKLEWVDALKGFAILGILLNHFVESFRSYPWFTNPYSDWPDLATRLGNIIPADGSIPFRLVKFFGWLGDMGPGVFILLSGLTLTLSAYRNRLSVIDFYRKRLWRIYPLYMVIHAVVLFVAVYVFHWEIEAFSVKTLLSFLGLRFNESLFFFINPSWWFIWLILQMYMLFPFLFLLLKKIRLQSFIFITLFITIISRLAGVAGWYEGEMFYWMTGMFGGSRLFEFTAGMVLAKIMVDKPDLWETFRKNKTGLLLWSLLFYIPGFIASWTYAGSLVSNSMISIGMSGLFLWIFQVFITSERIKKPLLWIGKNSFSVFLIHQPFMMYASGAFGGATKAIALTGAVAGSFVLGWLIERSLNMVISPSENEKTTIMKVLSGFKTGIIFYLLLFASLTLSFAFTFVSPAWMYKIIRVIFALLFINGVLQLYYLFLRKQKSSALIPLLSFMSLIFILLTGNWYSLFWVFVLLVILINYLLGKYATFLTFIINLTLVFALILSSELFLKKHAPLEMNKWGEFEALQPDDQTVYSLIPYKTSYLKYNNYEYQIITNSLGFTSPEYPQTRDDSSAFRIFLTGDAFTMPEGLNYEFSYAHLLETGLQESHPEREIQLFNGGVTGYSPNEIAAQLKKFTPVIEPDLVIVQLFTNEFEEIHLLPEERLKNIGFGKEESFRERLLLNAQLPAHFSIEIRNLLNIPNKEFRYIKSLAYLYEKDSEYYKSSSLKIMDKKIEEMKKICIQNGAELMIMYVPTQLEISSPEDVSYYPENIDLKDTLRYDFDLPRKIFRHICENEEIIFEDITETLKQNTKQPVYFRESWHWNKEGHKAAADFLKGRIDNQKIIE